MRQAPDSAGGRIDLMTTFCTSRLREVFCKHVPPTTHESLDKIQVFPSNSRHENMPVSQVTRWLYWEVRRVAEVDPLGRTWSDLGMKAILNACFHWVKMDRRAYSGRHNLYTGTPIPWNSAYCYVVIRIISPSRKTLMLSHWNLRNLFICHSFIYFFSEIFLWIYGH